MSDSIGLSRLFLAYIVGGIVVFIVNEVIGALRPVASGYSEGTKAAQGTQWLNTAVDYLPITYVLLGFFGLIAYSVFRRRVAA